jgi:cytidyltransferase-like protein
MAGVMAFGTFDLLHKGHESFLKAAASYGQLTVVVARDNNVTLIKGRSPVQDERARLLAVAKLPFVARAVLGGKQNLMDVIDEHEPEVICLGYDQDDMGLERYLLEVKKDIRIIRLKPHEPDKFKSSILRKGLLLKK